MLAESFEMCHGRSLPYTYTFGVSPCGKEFPVVRKCHGQDIVIVSRKHLFIFHSVHMRQLSWFLEVCDVPFFKNSVLACSVQIDAVRTDASYRVLVMNLFPNRPKRQQTRDMLVYFSLRFRDIFLQSLSNDITIHFRSVELVIRTYKLSTRPTHTQVRASCLTFSRYSLARRSLRSAGVSSLSLFSDSSLSM